MWEQSTKYSSTYFSLFRFVSSLERRREAFFSLWLLQLAPMSRQRRNHLLSKMASEEDLKSELKCQICSIEPKKEKALYNHYGGRCCLSCKQFFRRVVCEGTNIPQKKCIPTCNPSGKARSLCRSCRYQRCLMAGMDRDLVLTSAEDRKKYTHPKKQKKEIPPNQSTSSQVVTLEPNQSTSSQVPSMDPNQCTTTTLVAMDLIPENSLLILEESKWISQIQTLFYSRICKNIYYDGTYISRFVEAQIGNKGPDAIAPLALESSSIYTARFMHLIASGLGLDLNDINPLNYGLCIIACLAKGEHMPSVKHTLHFHTQSDNLDFFSALDKLPKDLGRFHKDNIAKEFNPEPQKMTILSEKVASFLQDSDICFLVILHILTGASLSSKVQGWNDSIKRLLLKKLRYLCGTTEVEQYLNIFCNQFLAYSFLMSKTLKLANSAHSTN